MKVKEILKLYKEWSGQSASDIKLLPAAASARRYYRIFPEDPSQPTVIATVGDDRLENRSFIALSRIFRQYGQSCDISSVSDIVCTSSGISSYKQGVDTSDLIPEVFAVNEDETIYLQEDCGEVSALDHISHLRESDPEMVESFLQKVLDNLVVLQNAPHIQWENGVMCRPFSPRQSLWDMNYFKYDFLKPSGVIFDEESLEDDFSRIAGNLGRIPLSLQGFMYRDFQSRNILVLPDGSMKFIDFQSGRRGPVYYDLVSLLWQSRLDLDPKLRSRLVDYYCHLVAKRRSIPARDVKERIPDMVLLRTLQVLGAYGFRGLVEKKVAFSKFIPQALANLKELRLLGALDQYPEIKRLSEVLEADHRWVAKPEPSHLTVEVFSFSYKNGYPSDWTGNGGGFMFDCRGLINPGRESRFKTLNGLDQEVVVYLKDDPKVAAFLKNAFGMVSISIENYISRKFSNLQIGFGCTGGQHRSVFMAQSLSNMLAETFPGIIIKISHREQGVSSVINPSLS